MFNEKLAEKLVAFDALFENPHFTYSYNEFTGCDSFECRLTDSLEKVDFYDDLDGVVYTMATPHGRNTSIMSFEDAEICFHKKAYLD